VPVMRPNLAFMHNTRGPVVSRVSFLPSFCPALLVLSPFFSYCNEKFTLCAEKMQLILTFPSPSLSSLTLSVAPSGKVSIDAKINNPVPRLYDKSRSGHRWPLASSPELFFSQPPALSPRLSFKEFRASRFDVVTPRK